ncbi:MAG: MazG family protein [Parachlamydia sp.]|jgi:MazG family protein|nr:MazG family protein [Parachlamydia sp.]
MEQFETLVAVIDLLLGPGGCPWDREQTLESMRNPLIEEAYEVVEAIHLNDKENLQEELGDLFFNVIFLCRLAEKEMRLRLEDVLAGIHEKLVRRHPHVFGEKELSSSKEVLKQWDAIKKEEKKGKNQSLPKSLPSLLKAGKLLKQFHKRGVDWKEKMDMQDDSFEMRLMTLLEEGVQQGFEPELALQKILQKMEK